MFGLRTNDHSSSGRTNGSTSGCTNERVANRSTTADKRPGRNLGGARLRLFIAGWLGSIRDGEGRIDREAGPKTIRDRGGVYGGVHWDCHPRLSAE